ncbi:MAG: hypothetical protein ACYCQJ_08795 [Nitrososphaerales archaeon]
MKTRNVTLLCCHSSMPGVEEFANHLTEHTAEALAIAAQTLVMKE